MRKPGTNLAATKDSLRIRRSPPGHYTLRVQGSISSGVWNLRGINLALTIVPAWYQTNWFYALCAAAILALLWGLYRLRLRQLQEQEAKFREAVQSIPAMAFIAGPDGLRTFFNDRSLEYTGYSLGQALGSGWQAAIHPDDLKRVLEKWDASLTSGSLSNTRRACAGRMGNTVGFWRELCPSATIDTKPSGGVARRPTLKTANARKNCRRIWPM